MLLINSQQIVQGQGQISCNVVLKWPQLAFKHLSQSLSNTNQAIHEITTAAFRWFSHSIRVVFCELQERAGYRETISRLERCESRKLQGEADMQWMQLAMLSLPCHSNSWKSP